MLLPVCETSCLQRTATVRACSCIRSSVDDTMTYTQWLPLVVTTLHHDVIHAHVVILLLYVAHLLPLYF